MNLPQSDITLLTTQSGSYYSASKWPPRAASLLRMFWHPTNDVDIVLPKECEPSDQGIRFINIRKILAKLSLTFVKI